jgi:hypothetical protein
VSDDYLFVQGQCIKLLSIKPKPGEHEDVYTIGMTEFDSGKSASQSS